MRVFNESTFCFDQFFYVIYSLAVHMTVSWGVFKLYSSADQTGYVIEGYPWIESFESAIRFILAMYETTHISYFAVVVINFMEIA